MKNSALFRLLVLSLLLSLPAAAAYAAPPLENTAAAAGAGHCPASHARLPSQEERQAIPPLELLHCFMTPAEIDTLRSSIGHDPQTTVTDPAFDSGELNPDGSPRPPLSAAQIAALTKMHSTLDPDMRAGAILRKFVANSDVGGILFGRTVIGSASAPQVVTTNTVRGFVGLERNTLGLGAGATVGALGLDYETTPTGQFTDQSDIPLHREVAVEILQHGLHSIRHIMSAQGAKDAKIPLGKDLNDSIQASTPSLSGRSFEMDRQGQGNPYTALGISHNIGLLTLVNHDGDTTYPLHLNEEDVMTVPTPLSVNDTLVRRHADGQEKVIARYLPIPQPDGSTANQWVLSRNLTHAEALYYGGLVQQAAAKVKAAGG
ncbi:MAG TPA: hypothetical protein VMM92_12080 [Thermoanaerobaculia bacterium]|nr:hypothetical protein [Thermoanaerobaculia bacterium]